MRRKGWALWAVGCWAAVAGERVRRKGWALWAVGCWAAVAGV